MFGLFKSPAAKQAEAAQKQSARQMHFLPVNDDAREEKYHRRFFAQDAAEET